MILFLLQEQPVRQFAFIIYVMHAMWASKRMHYVYIFVSNVYIISLICDEKDCDRTREKKNRNFIRCPFWRILMTFLSPFFSFSLLWLLSKYSCGTHLDDDVYEVGANDYCYCYRKTTCCEDYVFEEKTVSLQSEWFTLQHFPVEECSTEKTIISDDPTI